MCMLDIFSPCNMPFFASLNVREYFSVVAFYSSFRRKARVIKCKRFGRQKGFTVPGVSSRDRED